MSLQNAINLINTLDSDFQLRNGMYACKSVEETTKFLLSKGFMFTTDELNDAINSLHVKCQTLESAQDLMHKAELLKFILHLP